MRQLLRTAHDVRPRCRVIKYVADPRSIFFPSSSVDHSIAAVYSCLRTSFSICEWSSTIAGISRDILFNILSKCICYVSYLCYFSFAEYIMSTIYLYSNFLIFVISIIWFLELAGWFVRRVALPQALNSSCCCLIVKLLVITIVIYWIHFESNSESSTSSIVFCNRSSRTFFFPIVDRFFFCSSSRSCCIVIVLIGTCGICESAGNARLPIIWLSVLRSVLSFSMSVISPRFAIHVTAFAFVMLFLSAIWLSLPLARSLSLRDGGVIYIVATLTTFATSISSLLKEINAHYFASVPCMSYVARVLHNARPFVHDLRRTQRTTILYMSCDVLEEWPFRMRLTTYSTNDRFVHDLQRLDFAEIVLHATIFAMYTVLHAE